MEFGTQQAVCSVVNSRIPQMVSDRSHTIKKSDVLSVCERTKILAKLGREQAVKDFGREFVCYMADRWFKVLF